MLNDPSALFSALQPFGLTGIFIAYLIWRDIRAEKVREKIEEKQEAQRVLEEERRLAYDRERLECDKSLAAAFAALTSAVNSRGS